jgi:hypothetical protein
MRLLRAVLLFLLGVPLTPLLAPEVRAQEPPEISIVYLGDRFEPAEVLVPADA